MNSKEPSKKHFYLKWPWNLVVYLILIIFLRIFAVPPVLLLMWWNKKQQPDGPEEGYCLQRTRGRLFQLIWAAVFLLMGAAGIVWVIANWTEDRSGWEYMDYIKMAIAGVLAAGGMLGAVYEAYTGLRDVLCPEKSSLAKSIRAQLSHPEEAPPVRELFAMVDQDLKQNGRWFGKLGIGKEWVLGDEVSHIPRIRGVFSRVEKKTSNSGGRIRVTHIVQLWIVDNRQKRQFTNLNSPQELEGAINCLRQRAPAAIFGTYGSKEYNDLAYAGEMEWYVHDRDYRQRNAQFEEQEYERQNILPQNQVLTLPDGSVTSRITWDILHQLLVWPNRTEEPSPFQLVPGIPIQGESHTFSRLACLPGGSQKPTRILLEEYSGSPGRPGTYAWTRDMSVSEAEEVVQNWSQGRIPSLDGWILMERAGRTWQEAIKQQ